MPWAFAVGTRVSLGGELQGQVLPGKRRRRTKVFGTVTGTPDPSRGRVGYLVLLDGGNREQRVLEGKLTREHENAGRSIASPVNDEGRRQRLRLDPEAADAGSDGEASEDEFQDAVEQHQELDDDERVEGPGQISLDDMADIRELAGETETVTHKEFGAVTWTVVESETNVAENAAERVHVRERTSVEHNQIMPFLSTTHADFDLNLFDHLLWMPIANMAEVINAEAERQRSLPEDERYTGHWVPTNPKELGRWFALFLSAGAMGLGGHKCWTTDKSTPSLTHPKFEQFMSLNRFKEIKRFVSWTMAERPADEADDAWWRVRGAVNGFNSKRRSVLKVMRHIIADELMVPWESHLPTGGLPNLTFEPRKPEPLGTMFKCLLDNDTKVMSTLEICEGKERNLELAQDIHPYVTTSCTVRMLRETVPEDGLAKRIVCGDSWFASVPTAVSVMKGLGIPGGEIPAGNTAALKGSHFIGCVKTYHAQFPLKYIQGKLRGRRAGTRIVLEAVVDGVPLLALGWKYKRGSTLCYIATKGAGSTADDCNNPYKMRIKDLEGNPIDRQVLRPEIIGTYYRMSAGIDVHNQQRQGDLALEKVGLR